MSSIEPNDNNFKHSSEDQDLMSMKDQVYSGRYTTPAYENISRDSRQSQCIQFSECV